MSAAKKCEWRKEDSTLILCVNKLVRRQMVYSLKFVTSDCMLLVQDSAKSNIW